MSPDRFGGRGSGVVQSSDGAELAGPDSTDEGLPGIAREDEGGTLRILGVADGGETGEFGSNLNTVTALATVRALAPLSSGEVNVLHGSQNPSVLP